MQYKGSINVIITDDKDNVLGKITTNLQQRNIEIGLKEKKKYNKKKCMARIKELRQCSRNKIKNEEFCKIHFGKKLNFGRMDEEYLDVSNMRKKREIKEVEFKNNNGKIFIDGSEGVIVDDILINGEKHFIDKQNNIYDISTFEKMN